MTGQNWSVVPTKDSTYSGADEGAADGNPPPLEKKGVCLGGKQWGSYCDGKNVEDELGVLRYQSANLTSPET